MLSLQACAYDWDSLRGGEGSNGISCDSHTDALFCSGFESGDLSDWSPGFGDPAVIIEDSAAGSYAAKVETAGYGSSAFVQANVSLQGEVLYGRAFYYLPSSMAVTHFQALDVYDEPNQVFTMLFLGDGSTSATANAWINRGDSLTQGSVQLPRDQWFCVRFEARLGASGSVRAWVDDSLAFDASGDLSASGVDFVTMPARYTHNQAPYEQGPVEVWFDEVVFDDEPVGCP